MTLQVIGAGFGRTGTDSLRQALNMLGVGPCHHMHEVMPSEEQRDLWDKKTLGQDIAWDEIFDGFGSAVDWPSAYYWEELMGVYPDAKIILTYRDLESWWRSYERTILQVLHRIEGSGDLGLAWRILAEGEFSGQHADKDACVARYNQNIARVKSVVPTERLFIMELGEGWERLCHFLGVDVPAEPYPSGNTTTDFRQNLGLDPKPDE